MPRTDNAANQQESRRRANHTLASALLALWDMVPEERFGQFVMNLSRTDDGFADTWEWKHGAWLDAIQRRYERELVKRDRSAAKVGKSHRWNGLRSEIKHQGFGWWLLRLVQGRRLYGWKLWKP